MKKALVVVVVLAAISLYAESKRIWHVYPISESLVAIRCESGHPHAVHGGPNATVITVQCK